MIVQYSRQQRRRIERYNSREARKRNIADAMAGAPFDPELIQKLTGAQFRIVDAILYIQKLRRKSAPEKVPYVWMSQGWLAQKVGVSREWVSRCTDRLASLGVIRKITRRPEHGRWMTCLYLVSSRGRFSLGRLLNIFSSHHRSPPPLSDRVNYTSQKATHAGTSINTVGEFLSRRPFQSP